ncbi:hypothetical protein [Pyrinomonas sp.]|uniref:hypothetical protein n=1 Tax=Pyrinomonas sp. TaxID=2080306 RepID=UPI00332C8F9D
MAQRRRALWRATKTDGISVTALTGKKRFREWKSIGFGKVARRFTKKAPTFAYGSSLLGKISAAIGAMSSERLNTSQKERPSKGRLPSPSPGINRHQHRREAMMVMLFPVADSSFNDKARYAMSRFFQNVTGKARM